MKKFLIILSTLVMLNGCESIQAIRQSNALNAVGYASISEQAGNTDEEKQMRAMRASKMDAYRELAEQVYGLRISANASLADQRLGQESTSSAVDGVIRGAEVVRSYPVGDNYVTELRLDLRKMEKLRSAGDIQKVPERRKQTLF